MKTRLLRYLESLGLPADADTTAAIEFQEGLEGMERAVANLLDYDEANPSARTIADAGLRGIGVDPENPKDMLAPAGGEASTDDKQGARSAAHQQTGANPPPAADADAVRREAQEAERKRSIAVRKLGELAGVDATLITRADSEGWSVERASDAFTAARNERREGVNADVGGGVGIHSRTRSANCDTLIAAMMLRHGASDPTQCWPDRFRGTGELVTRSAVNDVAVEQACDRGAELAGLSLVEIARRALELDGVRCEPTVRGITEGIQSALRQGYGLANLQNVFTTSYTAIFMEGFGGPIDTTAPFVMERPVRDYKINERVSMGAISGPSVRRAMQEAEPVTFDDRKEVYRVTEFANQFTFDEQNLIDDSFDALEDYVPRDLGVVYGEIKPNYFYAELAANAAMRDGTALFHANHGNLTGSAALALATLTTVRTKMQLQREGTRNLNLAMAYIVVPPTLGDTAYGSVKDRVVVTGENLTRASMNAFSRHGITPVEDARLENGVTHPVTGTTYAGSASTWYGAAAQKTVEMGYVAQLGRNPRVRSHVLTQGRFGIGFDIQLTMGMKFLDWKGWQKATAS